MQNKYRKYQIITEIEKKWGFYINNLGRTVIEKNAAYPSLDHPDGYVFNWDKGRVLQEFHLVLITKGEGIFESDTTGKIKISDGDAFLIFPDVWHRYKPKKSVGWTERWIGFSGNIAVQFLNNGFFNLNEPLIFGCNTPTILNYFNQLFNLFDVESLGYQKIASGICLQLLGEIHNLKIAGNRIENLNSIVVEAKKKMYENLHENIDLKKIAINLGISYSKFRIDFKKQTGSSPLQYFLLLKIEKAKELLLNSNKYQKEIAFELGFESDYYFNRLFKQKTGMTPGKFRTTIRNI